VGLLYFYLFIYLFYIFIIFVCFCKFVVYFYVFLLTTFIVSLCISLLFLLYSVLLIFSFPVVILLSCFSSTCSVSPVVPFLFVHFCCQFQFYYSLFFSFSITSYHWNFDAFLSLPWYISHCTASICTCH